MYVTYGFKCYKCRTQLSVNKRSHYCFGKLTVYVPNIGKLNKQVDPDYCKRFGSRPNRLRRGGYEWRVLNAHYKEIGLVPKLRP